MRIKLPRRTAAFLCGAVLYIAGFLKLIDPAGASLVAESYLSFFRLGFLSFAAGPLAFALALCEALTGLSLMTGAFLKFFSKAAAVLIGLFTLITLILLIFNPQMDCGCFGEAFHLSHTQTFIKNVVLAALLAVAFLPPGQGCAGQCKGTGGKTIFFISGSAAALTALYSLFFLPIMDFTAFAPGARLYDEELAQRAEVPEPLFVYEKDGFKKEFRLDALPDTTWTFVRTHEREPFKGTAETLVSVSDASGVTCDSILLGGKVLALCVHSPAKVSRSRWHSIAEAVTSARRAGVRPVLLTATSPENFDAIAAGLPAEDRLMLTLPLYFADHKTLLTLVRSNGGAVLLSDGLVVDKWSYAGLPSAPRLEAAASKPAVSAMMEATITSRIVFYSLLLLGILPAAFL